MGENLFVCLIAIPVSGRAQIFTHEHTISYCLTISKLKENQDKVLRTRDVNELLYEALIFNRLFFNSDRDILMKIIPPRFEIRESVVFRILSRSPKPFSVCKKQKYSIVPENLLQRCFHVF